MNSNDWKELGKKVVEMGAPLLGGVLGGPAGAAAGTLIAGLVGGDPKDPKDLLSRLQLDAQSAVKLREIELNHKVRLEELALQATAMEYADIANARAREIETVKSTGKRDPIQMVLVIMGISLPILLIGFLIFHGLPGMEQGLMALVGGFIGIIVAKYSTIFDYYFGSSLGSLKKTQMMNGNGGKE